VISLNCGDEQRARYHIANCFHPFSHKRNDRPACEAKERSFASS
jgi:hypothetical protein